MTSARRATTFTPGMAESISEKVSDWQRVGVSSLSIDGNHQWSLTHESHHSACPEATRASRKALGLLLPTTRTNGADTLGAERQALRASQRDLRQAAPLQHALLLSQHGDRSGKAAAEVAEALRAS